MHHKSPLDGSVSLNETGSACFPDPFLKHIGKVNSFIIFNQNNTENFSIWAGNKLYLS